MYELKTSKKFDKQYKKIAKTKDIRFVDEVIEKLLAGKELEEKYQDHPLKGNFKTYRECHVKPDLLLVYKKQKDILLITCVRLGSHSEIF